MDELKPGMVISLQCHAVKLSNLPHCHQHKSVRTPYCWQHRYVYIEWLRGGKAGMAIMMDLSRKGEVEEVVVNGKNILMITVLHGGNSLTCPTCGKPESCREHQYYYVGLFPG